MTEATPIAVIVASCGRPRELGALVARLRSDGPAPVRIVLSVCDEAALPPPSALPRGDDLHVIVGRRGSCEQRNAALDALDGTAGLVVFFDDDYVPARGALAGISATFAACPELVGCEGVVLADGAAGAAIEEVRALELVRRHERRTHVGDAPRIERGLKGLYGCNMAFRASAVATLRFDERLPLYAWQEDVDFSWRACGGDPLRLGSSSAFAGVHRGVKSGRVSGVRFGYSQIANPLYLMGKGTMERRFGLRLAARNLLSNLVRSARPEPWVDRRGRLRGNLHALRDLLAGRLDPGRVLDL